MKKIMKYHDNIKSHPWNSSFCFEETEIMKLFGPSYNMSNSGSFSFWCSITGKHRESRWLGIISCSSTRIKLNE